MSELIFKITFLVLTILYIMIRVPFDKIYKKEEKIKKIDSSIEKTLLVLMAVGLLIIPTIWIITPILNRFELGLPIWLRIIGIILSVFSLVYFYWVHKILGTNWSPTLEIRKGHQLIKTGPYKSIRHPMYTQIWLWTIAQILIVSNNVAGFSGIVVWTLLYFLRVQKEEKMMIENFGDEYIEYMNNTGRVIPNLFRKVI